MDKFKNRQQAGLILAGLLKEYAKKPNVIALALARGGVPVAFEIATSLSIPLDVFIVRKLGLPEQDEFAMGAIASGDIIIYNEEVIRRLNISSTQIKGVIEVEKEELARRESLYRGNRALPNLEEKIVLLIDDGIATGYTMKAAISAIRLQNPDKIIVAVPVAAIESYNEMIKMVDKIICPLKPTNFYAVGFWYDNFEQISDNEVCELLK